MSKVKVHLIGVNLKAGRFELALRIALLNNFEGSSTTAPDGSSFHTVYLPNVYSDLQAGMTEHQFAGYLSSLQAKGDYRPTGQDFGEYRTNPVKK